MGYCAFVAPGRFTAELSELADSPTRFGVSRRRVEARCRSSLRTTLRSRLATLGERRMWICPEYSRNTSTKRQQVSENTSTKREQVPVACTTPRRPTTNGAGRCPRGFTRLRVVLVYDPKRALCLRLDYAGCAAQPWSLEFAAFRVVSQHARQRTNVHTHSIVSIRSLSHFGPTRRTHETDATNSRRLHRPTQDWECRNTLAI